MSLNRFSAVLCSAMACATIIAFLPSVVAQEGYDPATGTFDGFTPDDLDTEVPGATAGAGTSGITLLEPIGSCSSIAITPGVTTFLTYFECIFELVLDIAVGIAVVWVLIAGFMYMVSGGNQSLRSTAVSHIIWSVTGLLALLFAGFILKTINSIFYT